MREALTTADRDARIIPEETLVSALIARGFLPVDRYLSAAVTNVTRNVNANILIEYRITGEKHVSVVVFDADRRLEFEEFEATLTDDVAPLYPIWLDPDSSIGIRVGGNADSGSSFKMLSCSACQNPDFSPEARKRRIEGSVSMLVTVSAKGRATDIHVVKGLGYGLDEQTVKAVNGWRFSAAKDPKGQKIATRVPIEMTFRLLP